MKLNREINYTEAKGSNNWTKVIEKEDELKEIKRKIQWFMSIDEINLAWHYQIAEKNLMNQIEEMKRAIMK